jgi:hypothetical protein
MYILFSIGVPQVTTGSFGSGQEMVAGYRHERGLKLYIIGKKHGSPNAYEALVPTLTVTSNTSTDAIAKARGAQVNKKK